MGQRANEIDRENKGGWVYRSSRRYFHQRLSALTRLLVAARVLGLHGERDDTGGVKSLVDLHLELLGRSVVRSLAGNNFDIRVPRRQE
ncbi:hypothetical protein PM082_010013 [Marasmius tenuissimus]|nr:hypothetical protein PM082_010013 [Marasmius tenuissimus]